MYSFGVITALHVLPVSSHFGHQVQSPPSFLPELFSHALGTALTAARSPSSTLPLTIPAPSVAHVHLPQGPSLFLPHMLLLPVKYPAYKNISPVRLLQTLNGGGADMDLVRVSCHPIFPDPVSSQRHGHHHVSMSPCLPTTLLSPEAPVSPRHQQHAGQALVSTLPNWVALLCLGFHTSSPFCGSETRLAAWLARSLFFSLPHLLTA